MAESISVSKLVMSFLKADGSEMSLSYNYADPEVEAENLTALMNGIITNGSIFENVPAVSKSAKIVTTTTTELDIA